VTEQQQVQLPSLKYRKFTEQQQVQLPGMKYKKVTETAAGTAASPEI
jgi:hypothetical protein